MSGDSALVLWISFDCGSKCDVRICDGLPISCEIQASVVQQPGVRALPTTQKLRWQVTVIDTRNRVVHMVWATRLLHCTRLVVTHCDWVGSGQNVISGPGVLKAFCFL